MSDRDVIRLLASNPPRHPDFIDAFEAYTLALQAQDKAQVAFDKACAVTERREAELFAVADRLAGRGAADGGDHDG